MEQHPSNRMSSSGVIGDGKIGTGPGHLFTGIIIGGGITRRGVRGRFSWKVTTEDSSSDSTIGSTEEEIVWRELIVSYYRWSVDIWKIIFYLYFTYLIISSNSSNIPPLPHTFNSSVNALTISDFNLLNDINFPDTLFLFKFHGDILDSGLTIKAHVKKNLR